MYSCENENNYCELVGTVHSMPEFSHEIYEEKFYKFALMVERLSKSCDFINVTISEKLLTDDICLTTGEKVHITGQFRSYNNFSGEGSKLILTVFVKDIKMFQEGEEIDNPNQIILNGYICKEPIYRVTPFEREITDILLAVNRPHNKSDYIPCIAWGRNAKFASKLKVGSNVQIYGRVQSREYQKKLSETQIVERTAYEVSVTKLETISEQS